MDTTTASLALVCCACGMSSSASPRRARRCIDGYDWGSSHAPLTHTYRQHRCMAVNWSRSVDHQQTGYGWGYIRGYIWHRRLV